jgi:hypothetical protein
MSVFTDAEIEYLNKGPLQGSARRRPGIDTGSCEPNVRDAA